MFQINNCSFYIDKASFSITNHEAINDSRERDRPRAAQLGKKRQLYLFLINLTNATAKSVCIKEAKQKTNILT